MFAVVRAGGKQFRVSEGDVLTVDRLEAAPGSTLDLEVLAVGEGESMKVGAPALRGAVVTAEVLGERKGEKIDVLRYKPKVRYQRRRGHRRALTDLRITKIATD